MTDRLRAVRGGRRPERRTGEGQSVPVLERSLVAGLILDAAKAASAAEIVGAPDFQDPKLGRIFAAIQSMAADGHAAVDLPTLVDRLERTGKLQQAGGVELVAELSDYESTSCLVMTHAEGVRRAALERKACALHAEALEGRDVRADLAAVDRQLESIEEGDLLDPQKVGFTGDDLRALRERPEPISPLPGLLDPEPHLHVLAGKPKSGKTTFALWLARAWALGLAPWEGAPKLPGSRVLVLSREQSVTRLDSILRRLSTMAQGNGSDPWAWTDRITIVARDSGLDAAGRRLLTLDAEGLRTLRSLLLHAPESYGMVILDSLSRLKPIDVEENDAGAMAAWLDSIEAIGAEADTYPVLIHHQGHTGDSARGEARSAGRGSSAIAACAQGVWLLERSIDNPRHRVLKVDGNAILPAEHTFEVAGEKAELGSVLYFRPIDPLDAYAVADHVGEGDEISISELARRLSDSDEKPSGGALRLARSVLGHWKATGQVETREGARRSVLIRRSRSGG